MGTAKFDSVSTRSRGFPVCISVLGTTRIKLALSSLSKYYVHRFTMGQTGLCRIVSGRSSAWLERLLWEQEVEGSNPFAPTIFIERDLDSKVDLTGGDFSNPPLIPKAV